MHDGVWRQPAKNGPQEIFFRAAIRHPKEISTECDRMYNLHLEQVFLHLLRHEGRIMGRPSLVFFGVMTFSSAFGSTDFTCMSNCQSKGYQYQLCLEQCSYNGSASASGGYAAGYLEAQQAIEQIKQRQLQNQQLQMRNQMILNADAACKQGNQRACNDLRMMLFGK